MKRTAVLLALLVVVSGCAIRHADDAGPMTSAAGMPGRMSEADIAGIVTTANEGEIQQGQAASARATNAEVRAFAQMMVRDHTAANERGRMVFSRNNITPAENEVSRNLRSHSQQTISALSTYSGAAFDREYMNAQVQMHQWLLTSLDTQLIPSARNAEVRTLLQEQRTSVAAHLEHARRVLQGL